MYVGRYRLFVWSDDSSLMEPDILCTVETRSFRVGLSHLAGEVEFDNGHSLDCVLPMPLPGTIVLLELRTKIASAGYSQYLLKDHLVLTRFQEAASILCVHCHSSTSIETKYEWDSYGKFHICCPFQSLESTD